MQKLIFRNRNGKEINLTSGDYGITEWEGFSANELNIQSQQVPFQDGGVFLDALLEQRILSVTVAMNAKNDLEKRYRLRREMISTLNPKLGEGILIYTNDFLSKQIHVIPQLPVFENNNSNDSGTPKAGCSFVACNPYWEDIGETEVYLNLGETPVVTNDGDVPVQVKVDFFANNVNNPVITNLTNNKLLKYNGQLNTNLLIDTEIGNKQVLTEELGLKNSALGGYFSGVAYSEGKRKWVVVNNEGNLLTGRNLQNLNLVTVDVVRANLQSVVYSDELELFVAVGMHPGFVDAGGLIITSPDGENWTERLSSVGDNLFFVTFVKELHKFFATGDTCVYSSVDGENWGKLSSGGNYINSSLAYSSDLEKFVMTSSDGIYTSNDGGESWTETYSAGYSVNSVMFSKRLSEFIAVGNNNYVYTSIDGTNWESTSAVSGMSRNLNCIVEKNNILIAVGSTGLVLESYNGTDWNIIEIAEIAGKDCWILFATYIEQYGMFVICGRSEFIATSENGDKWEVVSFESVPSLYDVIYVEEKNKYYGVSSSEKIYSSPDGENWTLVWEPSSVKTTNLYSIVYSKSKGLFVACGEEGVVVTSADGESWARRTTQPAVDFNSVIYVDELEIFVMVGDEGTIMTSTNGSQWSQKNTSTFEDLKDVAYSGLLGKFVIVAAKSLIFENSDFTLNFHMPMRGDVELNSVAYNDKTGLFVVVGLYGLDNKERNSVFSMVSTDTENWENFADDHIPPIFGQVWLTSVCFSENYNAYIATSLNGKIFISDNGLDWKVQNVGCNDDLQKIKYISEIKTNVILSDNGGYFTLGLKSGVNAIQNIDSKSDMNFNLEVGDNTLQLTKDSGNFSVRITYRQKYLGV